MIAERLEDMIAMQPESLVRRTGAFTRTRSGRELRDSEGSCPASEDPE